MNKYTKILLISSIFIVPLSSLIEIPFTIVWYSQYLAVIILGFLIAAQYISKVNKPLAILLAYSLFSYIVVCQQHPRALLCLIVAAIGMLLIIAISEIENRKEIYISLIVMSVIQSLFVILQVFNKDPFFHLVDYKGISDTVGFLGSHNQLAAYHSAVMPFCLWTIPLMLIPLYYAHCSTAVIASIIGIGFYTFSMDAFKGVLFVLLVSLIAVVAWNKFDKPLEPFKERMAVWNMTIRQVQSGNMVINVPNGGSRILHCNPWLGYGIGSFTMFSPLSQKRENIISGRNVYEHAHNDLVEYFFEFGYVGLCILLFLIYDILWKYATCVNKTNELIVVFSSLIIQVVNSMGVYIIHAPVSYFMLCLTVGLFYGAHKHANKSESFTPA